MKLLLTSTGLSNDDLSAAFFDLLGSWDPQNIKVAFISTAATTQNEKNKAESNKQQLKELRIQESNIVEVDIEDGHSVQEIRGCDAMFVCGGNTFYLLHKLRETGFDIIIKNFIQRGGVYVGTSAGSIIMSPTIAVAGVEPADPNEVGLLDLSGLGIVDFEVSPHVPEEVSYEAMEQYSKGSGNEIIAIDDVSAVFVKNGRKSVVGVGKCKHYNLTSHSHI